MTFVSMATWVLSSPTWSDTCLCLWHYCCALLWFYWGVCVSSSFASFFSAFRPTAFFYSVMVTSLFTVCYLIPCKYLLMFQKVQTALASPPWIVVDPPPLLLSFGTHLHVHPGLPYAARPQQPDCQTCELPTHTYFELWQLNHTLSSDGAFVVERYWDIG